MRLLLPMLSYGRIRNRCKKAIVLLVIVAWLMLTVSPRLHPRIYTVPEMGTIICDHAISDEEGPVFSGWAVPSGGLANDTGVGIAVGVRDNDSISTVLLYSLSPYEDTWNCGVMNYVYTHGDGDDIYSLNYQVKVPDTGASVTFIFRFEANDTIGNWGVTENITTSVHLSPIPDSPAGNDLGPLLIWIGAGTTVLVLAIAVCYIVKRRIARP